MSSVLIRPLQAAIAARLKTVPEFAHGAVPVLTRLEKNITSEIEQALVKLGVCIQVFAPVIERVRPNSSGLYAETISTRVRCTEVPNINRTALELGEIQELVLHYLHNWVPAIDGANTLFAPENPTDEVPHSTMNILDIYLHTSGGFAVRVD